MGSVRLDVYVTPATPQHVLGDHIRIRDGIPLCTESLARRHEWFCQFTIPSFVGILRMLSLFYSIGTAAAHRMHTLRVEVCQMPT